MAVSLAVVQSGRIAPRARRSRFLGTLKVLRVLVAWPAAVITVVLFVIAVLSPIFLLGLFAAMAASL